jgi:hypothetical protein
MDGHIDPEFLYYQAMLAIRGKRLDDAQNLLVQVLHIDPQHEQAWLMMSSVAPSLQQTIACLYRVLALNPHNAQAKEWLTIALEAAHDNSDGAGTAPLPDERAVPFLGQYMLDHHIISTEELAAALRVQNAEAQAGAPRRIGEILVEQGVINTEQLKRIVHEQERDFFNLFYD